MSQNNEEIVLKSARALYKAVHTTEAKLVLEKLDSPEAKTLLAKMGGPSKANGSKNSSMLALSLGFVVIAVMAFILGWTFAPKTTVTVPDGMIVPSVDAGAAATATEGRLRYEASASAITGANENAMTQISASQTSAVEAATAQRRQVGNRRKGAVG